jgi:hypothetical protein
MPNIVTVTWFGWKHSYTNNFLCFYRYQIGTKGQIQGHQTGLRGRGCAQIARINWYRVCFAFWNNYDFFSLLPPLIHSILIHPFRYTHWQHRVPTNFGIASYRTIHCGIGGPQRQSAGSSNGQGRTESHLFVGWVNLLACFEVNCGFPICF